MHIPGVRDTRKNVGMNALRSGQLMIAGTEIAV
jgi:hypothetical protein